MNARLFGRISLCVTSKDVPFSPIARPQMSGATSVRPAALDRLLALTLAATVFADARTSCSRVTRVTNTCLLPAVATIRWCIGLRQAR